jgi:hypothetical protein
MRPPTWTPPIELSAAEQKVAKRIRQASLFLFLRKFATNYLMRFQTELAGLFSRLYSRKMGPIVPAQ